MPSTLTPADVRRIAALARLELTGAEVDRFAAQLTEILNYAAQLEEVDTSSVAPQAGATSPVRPGELRDDTPAPSLPRSTVFEQAPSADPAAGFFTVPRVLGS